MGPLEGAEVHLVLASSLAATRWRSNSLHSLPRKSELRLLIFEPELERGLGPRRARISLAAILGAPVVEREASSDATTTGSSIPCNVRGVLAANRVDSWFACIRRRLQADGAPLSSLTPVVETGDE